MSRSRARRPEIEALVAAYRDDLLAAGMFAENPVTSVARTFFTRVGVEGWSRLSLAEQCALPLKDRRVLGWLLVTGRVRPSPDYLVVCRPYLGEVAAHHHRVFHARFTAASADLGFERIVTRLQWSALAKVAALGGVSPEQLTAAGIQTGREALVAAIARHRPDSHAPKALSAALFGAQTTLFHLGVLDTPPRKTTRDRSAERAAAWAAVPPRLSATMSGYIAQTRLSLRASTMVRVEGVLREFAGWLALHAPDVCCVADLRRRHIETYKLHLAARPSARGGKLTKTSLAEHLGALRTCFERLTEWNGDDVPATVLIFAGDLPLRDDPLPRFLDDGAFTKLLQATRADPDPFVRLAVEFLARTGLRKGEFLDLTVDSIVQIGSAYWLHVPLGKLRTDRYIPLHPQLKQLLDDWVADRPRTLRSPWLFIEHGQRIRQGRVDRAVAKAAQAAGIGHVNPHRLRHTLATQAINRGMSLEAIAALLGHRSMRMTMVYARIANRTVADEYFAVSEKVEALYDAPRELPADAEGAEMRRLRAEMHPSDARQRLLRPPRRPGLSLRVHLRELHLLPDHHRVPAHPAASTRRRRRQGPTRPAEGLRRAARTTRGHRVMTGQPLRSTQPDEMPAPRTDSDSAAVLADTIDTLAQLRTPYWLGDSAVTLHALASLIAQANNTLPEAVAAARDQGHTWTEIGQLTNLSAATAARRYRNTT